ncbi:type I restriction-modification system subunit M [Candidatus Epulonipiscium fishelsonii]|uniref:Type I restriction-modification system subunit M n=1 Tax=Candidatus Epulonipiscium fishelsonii TaxID=77094 RepID=A0ACC8XFR1_9FIRM|nr:type I restriction-modification system subunit M [Epulopiscium sp. SCG-B11WGA-EpuloA1]ONI42539.1 type I restriction-modification system subunit M [Epulopiscium sp. SCG-B05WGA-EpuloA1]
MYQDKTTEQERAELHRSIWAIANDLRGSIDGWDFKHYVLGMLFYRYLSENITSYINKYEHEVGDTDFDYATLSDEDAETVREDMIQTKGFFILPSELFCNVQKNAEQNENLNETLANVFKNIESSAIGSESESNFKGLFDDIDVNSNKLGKTVAQRNEQLVKLLNGIADMKLGSFKDTSIDAFGDAYEYLMGMYASGAGKSGGEFFTPQEVSELLTRITLIGKTEVNKVYDPCCGSGSLLLKFAKILGQENVKNGFYGQEINITTYNLCRINMFLHDIGFENFNMTLGNTLTTPLNIDDEPFEAIVSNPPYSIKWEGNDNPLLMDDPRFAPAGVLAPKSKADLAFVMHALSWLAEGARAAIVCFPGIMYRGGAEQQIRKYLVDNNYIESIIQLPANLFFGTSISTCIMVLKKGKLDNKVLFIDASKEFKKVTNNNKLDTINIENILKTFEARENKQYLSYLANVEEIAQNDYNLSVSIYVEQEDTKQAINISDLNKAIKESIQRQQILTKRIEQSILEIL